MWNGLFERLKIRYKSMSWTKVFVCCFLALLLNTFIVIELCKPERRHGFSLHWNKFYNSVSDVIVNLKLRGTSYSQSLKSNNVSDDVKSNDVTREPPNDTSHCLNFSAGIVLPGRPEEFLDDSFAWQNVSGRVHVTYVFSAYHDDRLSPARLVIIGMSDQYDARKKASPRGEEFCRIWFPGEDKSEVVNAEFNFVPETHSRRYAASLHSCPLKRKDSVPFAVSLILDRCRQSKNVLRVQNHSGQKTPEVNYTVCASPLINSYNNYQQLVETVEVNRIFGAQEFVFYNLSADGIVVPFLNSYLEEGIARVVIPWNIPPVDIHYFGQVAALNDCLYRSMFRSRFLVFADLDELIVPRLHRTWDEMLDAVVGKMRAGKKKELLLPATFIFRSTIFRSLRLNNTSVSTNNNMTRVLGLRTLMDTVREARIFPDNSRTKYIARPEMFLMVGIHFPFNFITRSAAKTVNVDTNLGLVHHYRYKHLEVNDKMELVPDVSVRRFEDLIVSRTKVRYRKVEEISKRSKTKPPVIVV